MLCYECDLNGTKHKEKFSKGYNVWWFLKQLCDKFLFKRRIGLLELTGLPLNQIPIRGLKPDWTLRIICNGCCSYKVTEKKCTKNILWDVIYTSKTRCKSQKQLNVNKYRLTCSTFTTAYRTPLWCLTVLDASDAPLNRVCTWGIGPSWAYFLSWDDRSRNKWYVMLEDTWRGKK